MTRRLWRRQVRFLALAFCLTGASMPAAGEGCCVRRHPAIRFRHSRFDGAPVSVPPDIGARASDHVGSATRRIGQGPLARWLLAYGTFSMPQAAGPIAFALLAIPLTGDPRSGASIVLAITIAQVIGAGPVAQLGRNSN